MMLSLHHVICVEKDWKGIKMLPEYNTLMSHFGNQKHRLVFCIFSVFMYNYGIFPFISVTPITILLGIWRNIK